MLNFGIDARMPYWGLALSPSFLEELFLVAVLTACISGVAGRPEFQRLLPPPTSLMSQCPHYFLTTLTFRLEVLLLSLLPKSCFLKSVAFLFFQNLQSPLSIVYAICACCHRGPELEYHGY